MDVEGVGAVPFGQFSTGPGTKPPLAPPQLMSTQTQAAAAGLEAGTTTKKPCIDGFNSSTWPVPKGSEGPVMNMQLLSSGHAVQWNNTNPSCGNTAPSRCPYVDTMQECHDACGPGPHSLRVRQCLTV